MPADAMFEIGSVTGFDADTRWYPDAQLAVVIRMDNGGDAGDIAGKLAAELLPWQRPNVAAFTGDATPPVGTYKGPGRGRDFVIQVTQAPQGIAVSVNGGPPRPVDRGDDVPNHGRPLPDLPRRRPAPFGRLRMFGAEEAVKGDA